MLTTDQRDLFQMLAAALGRDPAIGAAWLAGSLGASRGDAHSDVDVLVLAIDEPASDAGARYAREANAITPAALINLLHGGRTVSVVTTDWRRYDLTFVQPSELQRYDPARLVPAFNHGDWAPSGGPPEPHTISPDGLSQAIEEFLRVLGLAVVAIGREEWLNAQRGTAILKQLTIDLMLDQNRLAPGNRGGALHLNRLLTPEQRAALEAVPPVTTGRESVVAASHAIASIFLPRARGLAREVGSQWPDRLEEATRRHLESHLGLVLP